MRNDKWDAAMAPEQPWKAAYAVVEAEAKGLLDTFGPAGRLHTTELVERLYTGSLKPTRDRMFKALRALSTHGLEAYVTRGEPEKVGRVEGARRLLWGAPGATVQPCATCPTCRRPL